VNAMPFGLLGAWKRAMLETGKPSCRLGWNKWLRLE
jgi:hypothetical protein